jgi:hypothetical protein
LKETRPLWPPQRGVGLQETNLGKTNPCVSLHYLLAICFAPSLADSFIFLTLTRLVVVFIFVNFSFALFTPPLGDYHSRCGEKNRGRHGHRDPVRGLDRARALKGALDRLSRCPVPPLEERPRLSCSRPRAIGGDRDSTISWKGEVCGGGDACGVCGRGQAMEGSAGARAR